MNRSAICLFAIFATLLMASCTTYRGSFELVNNASEPIINARVIVCGQSIELKGIAPTESKFVVFTVKGDSHYDIDIELQSGKTFHQENGYVTNGFNYHDTIVVTDAGVDLTNGLSSYLKMK